MAHTILQISRAIWGLNLFIRFGVYPAQKQKQCPSSRPVSFAAMPPAAPPKGRPSDDAPAPHLLRSAAPERAGMEVVF